MNFAVTLLQWFKNNGRSLPWRETKDAVLKAWQGLGYYSRARNLHTAAQQVMELGGFPQTFKELKTLKGVGDYTAAAIASIAFGEPVAVVDGNVYRVLSRYYGIETPIDSTEGKKEFQALAQSLLPVNEPADYNEAIMDFGATQCTPNSPHCSACPLCETCVAFREQRINELPVKSKKVKQRERHFTYLYIEYEGKIAIHQRGKGVKHILTHQILLADIYLWQPTRRPQLPSEFIWIEKQDLENYALPRLIEILLKAVPA